MGDDGVGDVCVGRIVGGCGGPVDVREVEITCDPDVFVWGDAGYGGVEVFEVICVCGGGSVECGDEK